MRHPAFHRQNGPPRKSMPFLSNDLDNRSDRQRLFEISRVSRKFLFFSRSLSHTSILRSTKFIRLNPCNRWVRWFWYLRSTRSYKFALWIVSKWIPRKTRSFTLINKRVRIKAFVSSYSIKVFVAMYNRVTGKNKRNSSWKDLPLSPAINYVPCRFTDKHELSKIYRGRSVSNFADFFQVSSVKRKGYRLKRREDAALQLS